MDEETITECLSRGPFDKATLSNLFGFDVPQSLSDLLSAISNKIAKPFWAPFETLASMQFRELSEPWECTKPEVFEFAGNGGDGHMFGYVVHAPELQEEDYPLAEYYPGEPESLRYFGESTVVGFSNYLADLLLYKLPNSFSFWKLEQIVPLLDADPELKERLLAHGVNPDAARQKSIGWQGATKVPAKIPTGWSYKPSFDGIGVLAPSSLFDESVSYNFKTMRGSDYRLTAAGCMRRGKYATALLLLREGYQAEFDLDDRHRDINLQISEAYEKLDRPILAQRARARFGD